MYIFKLKNEFKTKLYWNNPKYKLVNFENILKCFEKYDTKFYNLNWTSQRHFWLNLNNPDNVITTNKYFLISPVANLTELLKNPKVDWKIVYVNNFNYLNQQKTLLKVNFEVDNFFDLLKYNKDKLEISGLLSRTTLPKYTYYKVKDPLGTRIHISPNVLLQEDMNVSPYLLTKIQELFKYNKNEYKDMYFYNTTNDIVFKKPHDSDIKNNIIRKPLFISNDYDAQLSTEIDFEFEENSFLINTRIKREYFENVIEKTTLDALFSKFKDEKFLIILPIFHQKTDKHYFMDLTNSYSAFYPNTFIYRDLAPGKIIKTNEELLPPELKGTLSYAYAAPFYQGSYPAIYYKPSLTNRYFAITLDNVYLGYDDNIVDFVTYKSVPSLLKSNIDFAIERGDISPYLTLSSSSVEPQILDDIYFDHPEKKVKAGFMNASPNEINRLFRRVFKDTITSFQTSVLFQHFFFQYLDQLLFKLDEGIDSFLVYLQSKIRKKTRSFEDKIILSKNQQGTWQEYLKTKSLKHDFAFQLDWNSGLDPKILINKQFSNYLILSPNTRQEIDLDLYFTRPIIENFSSPALFHFHYSENEHYDAGYSILSYLFYNKNFVTKYLKNDTILSNAHVEYLKTNVNSINFQKQQESIQLARAYQDRTLGWLNGGVNLLTLGFQYNTNRQLASPTYSAIGANILAQNAFNSTTSIIGNTISANRGIEDSKRAIAKFYATQNDLYLQNKVDQNIVGIESAIELQEIAASVYKQTLTKSELEKVDKFLKKWGWKVNEYITDIAFNNSPGVVNTNLKFDYVEMEDMDFLPYLTNDENIYLQDIFKIGVWMIYDPSFRPSTFFEDKPPILVEKTVYEV